VIRPGRHIAHRERGAAERSRKKVPPAVHTT
jgi:hypothetical protein